MEFKIQTLFTCPVPSSVKVIKSFREMVANDKAFTVEEKADIIRQSFEAAGLEVLEINIVGGGLTANVALAELNGSALQVYMKEYPTLVVGDKLYKLEEFDV